MTLRIPLPNSPIREALATCALDGDEASVELLETIRRAEAGEPVGARHVRQFEEFMAKYESLGVD